MAQIPLTAEEEKEFREVFNLVDKDRGGTISRDELAQLMRTLSIEATSVRKRRNAVDLTDGFSISLFPSPV